MLLSLLWLVPFYFFVITLSLSLPQCQLLSQALITALYMQCSRLSIPIVIILGEHNMYVVGYTWLFPPHGNIYKSFNGNDTFKKNEILIQLNVYFAIHCYGQIPKHVLYIHHTSQTLNLHGQSTKRESTNHMV